MVAGPVDELVDGVEQPCANSGDLDAQFAGFLQERQVELLSLRRGEAEELQ